MRWPGDRRTGDMQIQVDGEEDFRRYLAEDISRVLAVSPLRVRVCYRALLCRGRLSKRLLPNLGAESCEWPPNILRALRPPTRTPLRGGGVRQVSGLEAAQPDTIATLEFLPGEPTGQDLVRRFARRRRKGRRSAARRWKGRLGSEGRWWGPGRNKNGFF